MSFFELTHSISYAPDRFEQSRFGEQMRAMTPQPRQVSLKTLLLITTLLCGAIGAVATAMRAAQQEAPLKQAK